MSRYKTLKPADVRLLAIIDIEADTAADIIAEMMTKHGILIEPQFRNESRKQKHYWRFKITNYQIDPEWIKMKWSDFEFDSEYDAILGAVYKIIDINWLNE